MTTVVKEKNIGDNVSQPDDKNENEDVVTPWVVKTTSAKGLDYDKLIGKFFSYIIKIYIFTIF